MLLQGVRSSIIIGLVIGAMLIAIAAYFLPGEETVITRGAASEELRESVGVVSPWVRELKDFKDFKDLKK